MHTAIDDRNIINSAYIVAHFAGKNGFNAIGHCQQGNPLKYREDNAAVYAD